MHAQRTPGNEANTDSSRSFQTGYSGHGFTYGIPIKFIVLRPLHSLCYLQYALWLIKYGGNAITYGIPIKFIVPRTLHSLCCLQYALWLIKYGGNAIL